MAKWQEQPEFGQKIWHEGIGSGKITGVDYSGRTIIADYYEKGSRTYEFDELFGNWDDNLGGTWMIYNI